MHLRRQHWIPLELELDVVVRRGIHLVLEKVCTAGSERGFYSASELEWLDVSPALDLW